MYRGLAAVCGLSILSNLHAGNGLSPKIASVTPAPGVIAALTNITVTFTEAVTNVSATDLLLNGNAVAAAVTGTNTVWTFTLETQPGYATIQLGWDAGHGIRDIDDDPAHRLDETDPANNWSYMLVDGTPPTAATIPAPGVTVRSLSQIDVEFSEPVVGVDAADLRINLSPANSVTALGAGKYRFQFASPTNGLVQVAWAAGHGITDFATPPNPFAGGAWSYTLDPGAGLARVRINEFLAANVNGLRDEFGNDEDWIEVANFGTNSVNLGGCSLTDDPEDPGRWTFPATNLAAGARIVVFASGRDIRSVTTPTNRFHTNFKLNAGGNYLALFNAESPRIVLTQFQPAYPEQRNNYSYGYDTNGTLKYFATPSPGTANGSSAISGVLSSPHFGVARGYFQTPFTLLLTSPDPGAQIRFTRDGSEPTAATGIVYAGPITVSNSVVVRAAAFRSNAVPSVTITHTYLFLDQVIRQPNNPSGFPTGATVMAGYPSDYEMDPEITTNAIYQPLIKDALRALPVISIGISSNDMWSPTTGIYTHPTSRGTAWEKPCNIEFIETNGESGFSVTAGIQIQGNAARDPAKQPKHPFKVLFKGDYGTSKLNFQMFPDSPVNEFESINLRADFNFSWLHWGGTQRPRGTRTRDAWMKDSMRALGGLASHNRYVHLFINGVYWGIYDPTERPDATFCASYLGGTKNDYDVVNEPIVNGNTAIDGDMIAYNQMVGLRNLQNVAQYDVMRTYLDVPQFIDYMMLHFYVGHEDWGFDKNYYCARKRDGTQGFRYIPWDGENILGLNANANRVSSTDVPSGLHTNLVTSLEYRLQFADRTHKHLFNGGALTPSAVIARWLNRSNEVYLPIVAESARWGDYRRDVHPYSETPYELYTRNNQWMAEHSRLTTTYFPVRTSNLLVQLRAAGLYPNVSAPVFSRLGGRVSRGFNLTMTASNVIYYTTNGIDPRVYGSGAISPQARTYASGVSIGNSMVVKARALSGTNWSALMEASYQADVLGPSLRITEIMYNPMGGDAYEYLELQNIGAAALDIGGYSLTGATYIFPPATVLTPGQFLVLGSSVAPNNWTNRYPGVTAFGRFSGSLANGGEKIAIRDTASQIVTSVDYDDENGWPTSADGAGFSLEVIDPLADPDDPANWRASTALNGTPGTGSNPPAPGLVLLNEIMADNPSAVENNGTFPDWIEMFNPGTQSVSLTGWSLTDSGNPRKFVFPPGITIDAGCYLVVWCDSVTNTTPGLHSDFRLDREGESIFLFDASTQRVDAVSFGLQIPNLTVGRVAGAWQLNTPTPNAANSAVPSLGASTNLSLNEWLADASGNNADWVELYNRSALPVSLHGLYLGTSNVTFQVTSLSFVPAGGFVQLFADEQPGPDHLDFKLSGSGGAIVLYDETGSEFTRVVYGAQSEGVTQGRLPNGTATILSFPGSASPGASNYVRTYSGPRWNEILAVNRTAITNELGATADFVELFNTNTIPFDLSGFSLSTDAEGTSPWFFPAGTSIGAGSYLVVWFDADHPASFTPDLPLNAGQNLDGESGAIFLFEPGGTPVDEIGYGFQVEDLSIGVSGAGWTLLTAPTPGGENSGPIALASNAALRLNEWMAFPLDGADWFEVHNTATAPVELSGLTLSDNPGSAGVNQFSVPALSYIGGRAQVRWIADGDTTAGRNHVNFGLDDSGEVLRLATAAGASLDTIYFGLQEPGVSQGRLPDGANQFVSFPTTATPADSNYLPLPRVVVNEILAHAEPPLESAIELYNPTGAGVELGGWFLSDSSHDRRKFRVPDGTFLPGGGYVVLTQTQFNSGALGGFQLDGSRNGRVIVSEADAAGNESGYRAQAGFGAAANGVSQGRIVTCSATQLVALSATTPGGPNAEPLVGPAVINEIMYHPPDTGTNDNSLDEFIELANLGDGRLDLFDPVHPAHTWRLRGGVQYDFAEGISIEVGEHLLVVNFDPALDPGQLASFRNRYGVAEEVIILGPYSGKLDNGGERIELQRPDVPVGSFVPYLVADSIQYDDLPPWPVGGDGDGASLQRIVAAEFGNEPHNWTAAPPSAGAANGLPGTRAPEFLVQPLSRTVPPGTEVTFSAAVCGNRPLAWQWRFNGAPLSNETSAVLRLISAQPAQAGEYSVQVSNASGTSLSSNATLALLALPLITSQPQSMNAIAGSTVMISVIAENGPLSYQWRRNGIALPGATGATLVLSNVQGSDSGDYTVSVSNPAGSVASAVATLDIPQPPTIVTQPQSQTVATNANVTFSVSATGTGLLRYQWRFNGTDRPGATNASLALSNVTLADAGDYQVLIVDDQGGIFSQVATLIVLMRPVITVQPTNITVLAGADATFFVQATGTLPISVRWRRGGATFTNGIILNTPSNSTLIVTNVNLTNNGNVFTAVVTNIAGQGQVSANAVLSVVQEPILSAPEFLPGAGFRFLLEGSRDRAYFIEVATDLPNWSVLGSLNYTNGRMPFLDTGATNNASRFYRARLVP